MISHATDAGNEWNALAGDILLFRPYRTKYSFINHARKPNLRLHLESEKLHLVPLHDIEPESELTLDYREEPLPLEYLTGHGATYL